MGLSGISVWQLLIILAIVVMLFGTSRLRSIGGDIGSAIQGFRRAMQDGNSEAGPEVVGGGDERGVITDTKESQRG